MRALWLSAVSLSLLLGCREGSRDETPSRDQNPAAPPTGAPLTTAQPVTGQSPQPGAASPATPDRGASRVEPSSGSVLSCRPGAEVQDLAGRLIDMADANGDGKVSKDEAQALTSFLVGGFFFRADENGDNTVTPDEGRQARMDFMNQHPAIASLFRAVRSTTGQSPFATVARLVDVEYGQPLSIAEARDAARGAVNDLYRVADADKDGVITFTEARTAAWEGAHALGRAAFQAADTDHSGGLSQGEFQAALQSSAKAAFTLSDTNNDGQLSEDEAAAATSRLGRMAGVQVASVQRK